MRLAGICAEAVLLTVVFVPGSAAVDAPHAPPPVTSCTVFSGVTLIDGTGGEPRLGVSVVVEGDRIWWVGPRPQTPARRQCAAVAGNGRYLIPGLWDMHVHLSKIGETALPLFVLNGVTGVRDMGGDFDEVRGWREDIRTGKRLGPRIKKPGPILESAKNVERMRQENVVEPIARTRIGVATPDEAATAVARLAAAGVDYIKMRTFADKETYFAIGAAAQRAGLAFVGHAQGISPDDILRSGQKSIEHALMPFLDERSEAERLDLFSSLARAGVVTVPTGSNLRDSLMVPVDRAEAIVNDARGDIDPRRRFISAHLLADWREQVEERRGPVPDYTGFAAKALRNLKEMRKAGVQVLPGTDVAVLLKYPGFSLHDELEFLVRDLGMSPMEALVAATRQSAALLGLQDQVGTIEVGRRADLLLLDADPTASIANTRRIAGVMAAGRYLDRAARDRILAAFNP